MARFRNISNDTREIPNGTPVRPSPGGAVAPDELFDVPDEYAAAFELQPWFSPAPSAPAKKKGD